MKSYLRFLSRNKLYTAIEVVGLSIALAFVMLIGSYIWLQYSIAHENPDYDRIYFPFQNLPYGIYEPMKDQIPEIEEITFINFLDDIVMESGDDRFVTRGLAVRGDFFDIFDYEFVIGDGKCLASYTDIIVSESYATKIAGKPELAIGMKIQPLDYDCGSYTVTGVIKDFKYKYWKYMDFICKGESPINDGAQQNPIFTLSGVTFLQVMEGTDQDTLRAKIQSVFKQLWGENGIPADRVNQFADHIEIERFDNLLFSGDELDPYLSMADKRQVIILIIVALLVLISAVINYINLNLALTNRRAKEMATRSLVGADKVYIAAKYILESICFTALCAIAAIGIAVALAPYVGRLIDGQAILIPFSAGSLLIYILFVVIVGGICGLIPALNISSIKPISIVNGTYRRKTRAGLNRFFILLQTILAITLIGSGIVLDKQMDHMMDMPLGADVSNKFVIQTGADQAEEVLPMMDEIAALPFVKNVALSNGYPTGIRFSTVLMKDGSDLTNVSIVICDTKAFEMWGFEIKEDFGTPLAYSVWFTESLYNHFEDRNAAEKQAEKWDGDFNRTKVDHFGGVLGNIAGDNAMNESISQSKVAVFVMPIDDFGRYNNDILIETDGNHEAAEEAFDRIYRKFSEEYNGVYLEPWVFGYVEDMIARELEEGNTTITLLKIFAILAVLLSVLGLVAMSTYFAAEREKGIAIRKVFGSTMSGEARRNITEYMIITIIGSVIAVPLSWMFCERYLEQFAYRIELSVWPFIVATLFALFISLISILWQTLRAARTNPAEALKKE